MSTPLTITVKYFASIRESIGHSSESVQTHASTVGQLRTELARRGGAYTQCLDTAFNNKAMRMALNHEMCNENAPLSEGCELAFFPPVTGG